MSKVHSEATVLLFVLALTALTAGCAKKDLVKRISEDIREVSDTIAEASRPIPNALIGEASRALEDSLRPVLDSTLASLFARVQTEVATLQDSLSHFAAADLNDSLGVLLDSNLELVRKRVGVALDEWLAGLATSLDTEILPLIDGELGPRLALAADTAVGQATGTLTARLSADGDLRNAVVALAGDVVDEALTRISENDRPTPWWIWAAAIGFALVVVALVGLFIVRLKRAVDRRDHSLRLVSLAVKERGDEAVTNRVKELATQHGVEHWLHSYLEENRLLAENGAAEQVSQGRG